MNLNKIKKYLNPNPLPKQAVDPYIKLVVEDHGKDFAPAMLPKKIKRGRIGDCFDTCMHNLIQNHSAGYGYVEGIAQTGGQEFYHSWLTDPYGQEAYDPTWFTLDNQTGEEVIPRTVKYRGLIFWPEDVFLFVRATHYKALLINRDKNRPLYMTAFARAIGFTLHAKQNEGNL